MEPQKEPQTCNECGQMVKLYRRKLNSGIARTLIHIYKHFKTVPDGEYLQVEAHFRGKKISNTSHDWPLLRHWDLLEQKKGERDDGSTRNGYYKLTEKGRLFAKGIIKINSHIEVYNNKFYGFSGKLITIKEALTSKFNYDELMIS